MTTLKAISLSIVAALGLTLAQSHAAPAAPPATKAATNGTSGSAPKVRSTSTTIGLIDPSKVAPELKELTNEVNRLRLERTKLQYQNFIHDDKLKSELAAQLARQKRLELENKLAEAELKKELTRRTQDIQKLKLEADKITQNLALESAKAKQKIEKEIAKLKDDHQRLQIENAVATAKAQRRTEEARAQQAELELEASRLRAEMTRLESEGDRRNYADSKPVYLSNPLKDGTLLLSDRVIPMNGVVSSRMADYIADRINYFNNRSTKHPIFILIDDSPGGSVMAGYKILKSMHGSAAPVHVVVRTFAASMAACITTLADESYAYPNAIILHHQMSYLGYGNMKQQEERRREAEEWWRRLAKPLAEKMGITVDDFVEKMYEKESSGDWAEFADKAVELKWVDHIVEDIRETGVIKNPDAKRTATRSITLSQTSGSQADRDPQALVEKIDEKGKPYMQLPRLNPFDCYFIFNPDNYYRMY